MSSVVRKRQSFSAEFKRGAIDLVLNKGMKSSQVGRDLGIAPGVVGRWVKEFLNSDSGAFPGRGRLSPQDQKISDLEQEVRQLKMERDILKKATAFFANHGR